MAEWAELQKMQGCRLPELMDSLDFTIYLALAEFSVFRSSSSEYQIDNCSTGTILLKPVSPVEIP